MNVNSLIASLIPTPTAPSGSAAGSTSATAESGAQFQAQFGQAVAALSDAVANAQGSTSTTGTASAGSGATSLQTLTDALTAGLQKKIADLLASGVTVSDIVQQLAAALANAFAGQFGGNTAQIQTQLQTAFSSALSPTGSGPPSAVDLASTLAQRFRQVADLAAGAIGETGQSNRLFAGSFSDAATTAGGQPAPGSTNGTNADSIASDASALLANLTASPGDGKTVATTAPLIGTNGDTLLGRILARADASSSASDSLATTVDPSNGPAPADTTVPTSVLVNRAIAAATAFLDVPASTTPVASPTTLLAAGAAALARVDFLATTASSALASATASTAATGETTAPAVTGSVNAFLTSFSEALAGNGASALTDKPVEGDGTVTGPIANVTSPQAPTIGAFAPVAPALHVDALAANPANPTVAAYAPGTDQNAVIEQILRGAFLSTTGPTSTVRLKLLPESLGDVSVNLSITGSSVSAQVVAQTPAAHDALVAGQQQLSRSLAESGLKLTSFDVSLAGGFSSFQQQQQQSGQQQASTSGRRLLLGDVDTPETDESSLLAIPSFAPSSSAATGWGAYNYLV